MLPTYPVEAAIRGIGAVLGKKTHLDDWVVEGRFAEDGRYSEVARYAGEGSRAGRKQKKKFQK